MGTGVIPIRALSGIALAALSLPSWLQGQMVRGHLVDRGNGFPIGSAFVVLLDDAAREVDRILTGPDGGFLLRAPGPGVYRLQSKRIGFRVSMSPPITLAAGQTAGYRLEVEAVPASLPPVVVEGHPQCGTRGEEGTAVARLWEEVREALAGVRWTAGQGALSFTLERFERDFAVAGGRVLKERRSSHSGYAESPFKSIPGEQLVARGYVVSGPRDSVDYYAPDAEVLLGDDFVNTHCFNAREGGDQRPGLVGLVFEPAPGRTLPDVEGVLWIEKTSLELRSLEFAYVKLPWGFPEGALGGEVEFMRLPTGAWIVKDWWIRMAQMAHVVYRESGRAPEPKVLGFREAGGEIVTISAPSRAVLFSALDAILEGAVTDSTRGGLPLVGATVSLEGTDRETRTDGQGHFQLAARLDGEYALRFSHPRLDSLAFTPDARPVRLARGQRATVALTVPPEPAITARLCSGVLEAGERVIVGKVRLPGGGGPSPGMEVRATWQSVHGVAGGLVLGDQRAVTTTDARGSYVLCRIPEDEQVTVRVHTQTGVGAEVVLDFSQTGVWINERQYRSLPGRIWKQDFQITP